MMPTARLEEIGTFWAGLQAENKQGFVGRGHDLTLEAMPCMPCMRPEEFHDEGSGHLLNEVLKQP